MQPIIKIKLEEDEIQRYIPYAPFRETTHLHSTGTAKRLREEMGIDDNLFRRLRAKARRLYYHSPKTMFISLTELEEWDKIGEYLSKLFTKY